MSAYKPEGCLTMRAIGRIIVVFLLLNSSISSASQKPILQPADEKALVTVGAPQVSPDGKWVAYVSNESGENEIYVRPFPGPGGRWQISRGGGRAPVWSRDGSELYYVKRPRKLMAVSVDAEGESLRAGKPRELFELSGRPMGNYDVAADGSFFMAIRDPEEEPEETRSLVTFVFNWPTELDRLVP